MVIVEPIDDEDRTDVDEEERIKARDNRKMYFDYLSQLMKEQQRCRRDEHLVEAWVECALKEGDGSGGPHGANKMTTDKAKELERRDKLFANAGYPIRNSHLYQWKHNNDVLRPVVDDEHQHVYAYNPRHLKYLCKKYVLLFVLTPHPLPFSVLETGYKIRCSDCNNVMAKGEIG